MNSNQTPPRFVPTLTEVVQPGSQPDLAQHTPTTASLEHFEDQMVHRVMQRVDLVLERRLREAVGQLILTHTQALGPRLREEIELVVRESVSQAVAQELPRDPGDYPA